ncbi:hypothetical protein ABW19_dt0202214 [Dactylella cylindrospora]|nr:hypothetical protein ABW19_dt0202214 [Dactylella cylindrospora]
MTFTLPRIPSFRLSWRTSELPAFYPPPPPTPQDHGSRSRRESSRSTASSGRMSAMSGPKSPDMPPQMPSISETIQQPPHSRRSALLSPQPAVAQLPRIETYPSQSIMAQDMHTPTTPPSGNSDPARRQSRRQSRIVPGSLSLTETAKSWWNRPELKTRVLILLVWSVVFIVVLSVYLGLFMNDKIQSAPLQIALILITLMAAFFFFHALVRVCLAVARPFSYPDEEQPQPNYANSAFAGMTLGPGPFGYAQPARPIQVQMMPGQNGTVLDDEGVPKDLPPPPPAYGLWRQSVRVNPDQFYWMRRNRQSQPPIPEGHERRDSRSSTSTRPPSYASRHRVEYERQQYDALRSPPPIMEDLPPHPSEAGRIPGRLPIN